MSRYSESQYRAQRTIVQRIGGIYSQARIYHLPHAKIVDLLGKVYNSAEYKRANGYTRSYIAGVACTLGDLHYRELAWGFKVDGLIMTVDEMRARWPSDWYTRCENDTADTTGNGTHFYPAEDPQKRSPF